MNDTVTTTAPPVIRPAGPGEARHVRRIFRTTLLLGLPLPIAYRDLYDYESLCLDWYLTNGVVRVVEVDGQVRGYLLACLDQAAFERWARPRAARWAARALGHVATGELSGDARRFVRLRVHDGLAAWRGRVPPPHRAHAHLNLDPQVQDASIGHRLAACVDDLVAGVGLDGWFGEIDVPRGRPLSAIERTGAVVVHRVPNRTSSWLLGTPVDRVTVARSVAAATARR